MFAGDHRRGPSMTAAGATRASPAVTPPAAFSLAPLCSVGSAFPYMLYWILKVLTNEKRGGLTVVSFDRSPFVGGIWINFGGFFTIVKPFWLGSIFWFVWRIFIGASPIIAMTLKYLCRNTKRRADFLRYLKIFMMESRFLPSFQTSGRM